MNKVYPQLRGTGTLFFAAESISVYRAPIESSSTQRQMSYPSQARLRTARPETTRYLHCPPPPLGLDMTQGRDYCEEHGRIQSAQLSNLPQSQLK